MLYFTKFGFYKSIKESNYMNKQIWILLLLQVNFLNSMIRHSAKILSRTNQVNFLLRQIASTTQKSACSAYTNSNIERTFAIIKPDVVTENGDQIIDIIKKAGFEILDLKKLHMSRDLAEHFYDIHKEKPFFKDIIDFMTSGPVIVLVLEKENAVNAWRNLIGATNPANAAEGTIRKQFGKNLDNNAVHGSDALETATREIGIFFPELN